MRHRVLVAGAIALAASLTLGACTGGADERTTELTAVTTQPEAALTVVGSENETEASLQTSAQLFEAAPVVVLASQGDAPAQRIAAEAAVGLAAPMLVSPAEATGDAATALAAELHRLGTSTVVSVGTTRTVDELAPEGSGSDGSDADELEVLEVDATVAAVEAATGLDLAASDPAAGAAAPTAADIAALPRPTMDSPVGQGDADLPPVIPGAEVTDALALTVDADRNLASIATARAAGVAVRLVPGTSPNPQADPATIDALHASSTTQTLAIGPEFAAEAALEWKVRAARTGVQLPGGGQQVFAGRQYVALYGTPGTPSMGVLGEQDLAAAVQRTKDVAAPYQGLTDKTVVPMFEIITTVAAGSAGPDGNYSNELDIATLRPWVEEAGRQGIAVVLDLQPGRTDFLTQAKQYEELLTLPHVGLAIDPEWRLASDQVHLRQIGAVDTAEINTVTQWLAELTSANSLPQKMVVLHQFRLSMIRDRASLDMSHPELAMLIHADGLGSQPDKQASWRALHQDAPAGIAWGWKNFYDEDTPMLDPAQTVTEVAPVPDLVTYQ